MKGKLWNMTLSLARMKLIYGGELLIIKFKFNSINKLWQVRILLNSKSHIHLDMQSTQVNEIFNLFDKNSDGKVHTAELGTIVRALELNPTESEILEMQAKVDPHKSGEFTLEALKSLLANRPKDVDSLDDLKEALRVFDSDKDGRITTEEFKYAMMTMGEKM